jgi:hypothetical protein
MAIAVISIIFAVFLSLLAVYSGCSIGWEGPGLFIFLGGFHWWWPRYGTNISWSEYTFGWRMAFFNRRIQIADIRKYELFIPALSVMIANSNYSEPFVLKIWTKGSKRPKVTLQMRIYSIEDIKSLMVALNRATM